MENFFMTPSIYKCFLATIHIPGSSTETHSVTLCPSCPLFQGLRRRHSVQDPCPQGIAGLSGHKAGTMAGIKSTQSSVRNSAQ